IQRLGNARLAAIVRIVEIVAHPAFPNCGWRLSGNTARFPICLLPCRTCFSKAPSNLAVRVNGLIPTCYLVRGNQFIQTCGPANCAGPHFPENLTGPSPRSPRAKLSAGRGRVLPPKGCEDPKG